VAIGMQWLRVFGTGWNAAQHYRTSASTGRGAAFRNDYDIADDWPKWDSELCSARESATTLRCAGPVIEYGSSDVINFV